MTAPGASDWLKVTPSPGLGLRLSPDEAQVLIKWWLGLPLFEDGATCPLCGPQEPLDKLGHHVTTCKRGPHVCCRHNALRGVLFEFFSRALLSPELEKGSGMDHLHSQTRPTDILVPSWSIGKSAACDVTVVNPLNPSLILGASTTVGYSAAEKEVVKMTKNGRKCAELGWECIPLAVETYGG